MSMHADDALQGTGFRAGIAYALDQTSEQHRVLARAHSLSVSRVGRHVPNADQHENARAYLSALVWNEHVALTTTGLQELLAYLQALHSAFVVNEDRQRGQLHADETMQQVLLSQAVIETDDMNAAVQVISQLLVAVAVHGMFGQD